LTYNSWPVMISVAV